MATRLNPRHTDSCLQRIQTSQLINRLQNHALGKLKIPMTADQVKAAAFLVERTLARAESPRKLTLDGQISLEQLITQARGGKPSGG